MENGRSLRRRYNRLSRQLAVCHGKVFGAGSDAHYPGELGGAVLQVDRPAGSGDLPAGPPARNDLLELLRSGRPVRAEGMHVRVLAWWFLARVGLDELRRRFIHEPTG